VTPDPPSGDGLAVPFLVDPEHEDVAAHVADKRFFWLDLQGPSERQLQKLAQLFDLHPLTVEDARRFGESPKLEEYGSYIYMVAFGVDPGTTSGGPLLREVHLIVSGRYVVTIHRRPFKALEELRERYDAHRVRSEQFLVYKILDAVTTTFFPVLSRIDDDIDQIEEDVVEDPNEEILRRIFSIKRDLVAMRRVVTPQRDVFARDAERIGDLRGMEDDDRLYYRDLYDTQIRVADLVDSYRDLLSGATDMYLSTVANRQGEINKQLTMIATIFLPLTFITGFFGQNFKYLVTNWINTDWSFWVFGVGLLVFSIIGFIIFFRSRRWM
jgi:magnesium transporter